MIESTELVVVSSSFKYLLGLTIGLALGLSIKFCLLKRSGII